MGKNIGPLLIFSLMMVVFTGCSIGNQLTPSLQDTKDVSLNIPHDQIPDTSPSNRALWGIWQFQYDELSGELTPVPLRETEAHFNITPMLLPPNCADCLHVKVNFFDPVTRILNVDVTLRNSTPITGHDVRGILYTNDYGHQLTNADDWTTLWDIPGGETTNPFKAFAKSVDHRAFAPAYVDTENYLIHIPVPANWNKITYAVDASWPGNCKEPYSIENFAQETLYNTGGAQAQLLVDVLDWQDDVDSVSLACNSIIGVDYFPLEKMAGNTWGKYIQNYAGAPAGEYPAILTATSANSGSVKLSDHVTITVTELTAWSGIARTWGGIEDDGGLGVTTDGAGNVYVIGRFKGSNVDFDPGDGSDIHSSNGNWDAFITKFNLSGTFQWARTWGGTGEDRGNSVATDSSGNVYVTGLFESTDVDFDPGSGSDIHSSNGGYDGFLTTFNSSGAFQWARTWGGADWDWGYGVATDNSGNVYVIGLFESTNVDFDPGIGSDFHSSNGGSDAFLSTFNSSGTFQWARTWGGANADWGNSVATDGSDNVTVTGFFMGMTIDFDPGAGTELHSSVGERDVFLSKFNSSGTFQWARTWGGLVDDAGYGVTTDISENVYVTGYFQDVDVDFDPSGGSDIHSSNGGEDVFTSKFDSSGTFQWARTWGGATFDQGLGVTVDVYSNVFVTGAFTGTDVNFDPVGGLDLHSSNGNWDVFLSNLVSDGTFQGARTWGGFVDDFGYGVAHDNSGSVFITGQFKGPVDFDPGPGSEDHTSNGQNYDVFLSRLPTGG